MQQQFWGRWFGAALLAASAATVLAQSGVSIMLRVTRKDAAAVTSNYRTSDGMYRSNSGSDTVSYAVEAINASTGALSQVTFRWSVLVKDLNSTRQKVIEGKKVLDMARGGKATFETDQIELGSFYRSTYSSSRSRNAEIVGYLVEVVVDGNVVSSDAKPMDIRAKITQTQNEAEPKRHRF